MRSKAIVHLWSGQAGGNSTRDSRALEFLGGADCSKTGMRKVKVQGVVELSS